MVTPEEKQHLQKLKQGELTSFNWIFSHHYRNVYNFCLSFTKSPADAEEITTDVFVVIWNKRSTIDDDRPLRPLLFKITKDLTWNFLKQTARNHVNRELFLLNYKQHTNHLADANLLTREYEHHLLRIIEKLTPQQQKIFTLKYFKGKDLTQIAEELAISKNTVKSHLAKSKHFVFTQIPSLGVFVFLLIWILS